MLPKNKAYKELLDERNQLQAERDALLGFFRYFKDLSNTDLGVANWHQNGNFEPFDNFFDEAAAQCYNFIVDNEHAKSFAVLLFGPPPEPDSGLILGKSASQIIVDDPFAEEETE